MAALTGWPGYQRRWGRTDQPEPSFDEPISQACTAWQFESPAFAAWASAIHHDVWPHRKLWEYCYILQCLEVYGALRAGAVGLGFGVGVEPIPSLLATRGCRVLATDLAMQAGSSVEWLNSGQHVRESRDLNRWGICDAATFAERVEYRDVDMRSIPAELRNFDFTWSSCAMEHLGSIDAAIDFFLAQFECLRPGGVAVHTTEYNVSSNARTVTGGSDVLLRRGDLEALVARTSAAGHDIRIVFATGTAPHDRRIDYLPYDEKVHLKVYYEGFVTTSFGLLAVKDPRPSG